MAMESLSNSRQDSTEFIEYRQKMLGSIIEEAAIRKDIVDNNYLQEQMFERGIQNYTRDKLYQDKLALDSQNTYIRDFLPRYSRFQEEILDSINEMERRCIELSERDWGITKTIQRETKDGLMKTVILEETNHKPIADFMRIQAKCIELKQKHGEGQNIQISAVIVGKEIAAKKAEIVRQAEEIKKLNILATKNEK